jgi:benzodiazapine receptor
MNRAWLFPILIAGVSALIVAVMGATVTDIGPWYHSLVQPRWAPADAAYGVAWTAIYAFTALAGVSGWLAMDRRVEREGLIGLFALSGFLNILWSLLFFRFHRPDWALIEVVVLWLSVAALIVVIWRRSMTGAALLLPYLLWVTFAGYLNMAVVKLNGPFS